jgi:hypothetical protein
MWGSDYPHGDSIFPESQQILDSLFPPHEEEDRFAVTAANVVKLYNLPFDLGEVKLASASTRAEVAVPGAA